MWRRIWRAHSRLYSTMRRRSRSRSRSAERKEDKAKIAFGKYGILRETDMSAKYDEFRLWTLEVRLRCFVFATCCFAECIFAACLFS